MSPHGRFAFFASAFSPGYLGRLSGCGARRSRAPAFSPGCLNCLSGYCAKRSRAPAFSPGGSRPSFGLRRHALTCPGVLAGGLSRFSGYGAKHSRAPAFSPGCLSRLSAKSTISTHTCTAPPGALPRLNRLSADLTISTLRKASTTDSPWRCCLNRLSADLTISTREGRVASVHTTSSQSPFG